MGSKFDLDEILRAADDEKPEVLDRDLDSARIATGAGKRLNNKSLYIGFGLVGTFLFFLFWVMYDKAQDPGSFGGASSKTAEDAGSMAALLTANAPSGLISPETSPPEPELRGFAGPDLADSPEFTFPVASDLDRPPPPPLMTEEERRVRQLKIQMFEQALLSKTNVPYEGARPRSSSGGGNSGYQFDEVQSRLSETRARLAQMQSSGGEQNVTQAYLARVAAIRDGGSQTGSGNDLGGARDNIGGGGTSSAGGGDRWLLQNNTAPGENPVEKPRTRYEVRAGGVIPATLISGINSDLPGQIIGQTTQAVYDTATGKHQVIPQGTRLIGMYDSQVNFGQERVLIAWQRLIFPDGKALDLGSMPGGDSHGYSGFRDQVNTHFWRTIGSAFLMSGIIAGVSLSQPVSTGDTQRASDALSEALGQTLGQTLSQMIQKNLNISPTLQIRPGYRFNVIITKDIPFTQPYQSFDF